MSTNESAEAKVQAIGANLNALNKLLTIAAKCSGEAQECARRGECNQAIGTILDIDSILDDAKALYSAALALHRMKLT